MKRALFRRLFILGLAVFSDLGWAARAPEVSQIKVLIKEQDYLGARIFIKKNLKKFRRPSDWLELRAQLIRSVEYLGFDLLYAIDRKPAPGLVSGSLDMNRSRELASRMMIEGKFLESFKIYQQIAVELKKIRRFSTSQDEKVAVDFMMPFIFQSMGRALYGAGRFDEAYVVFRWIPQTFPRIREVQFEKMWAAFRGGRVDHALGAIASQSSPYFSSYLSPESYLVQTYLYKKLCRLEDANKVLGQMRTLLSHVKQGKYSIQEFARSDLETLALWNLQKLDTRASVTRWGITASDREKEKQRLGKVLAKAFTNHRKRLLDDLEKVLAYVQLTVRSGDSGILKPIGKLPDRQKLYDLGLAIWPADSEEAWIDEIGTHRFVGESLCKKRN